MLLSELRPKSAFFIFALLLLYLVCSPAVGTAGTDRGAASLWGAVDMERLYFLGCTLYGYVPGNDYLMDDLVTIEKHRKKLEVVAEQISRFEYEKTMCLQEHERSVRLLMESKPDEFEEKLRELDQWLDGKIEQVLSKIRPLREKSKNLQRHLEEDRQKSLNIRRNAPDTVHAALANFLAETINEKGIALVVNTSAFAHGRLPVPEETISMKTLMKTPLKAPLGTETPADIPEFTRWWNLRFDLCYDLSTHNVSVPFLLAGGEDLSSAVTTKLLQGAVNHAGHGKVERMWQVAQSSGGTAVPGSHGSAGAKPTAAIATVNLDMLLLFHPGMADFIPAYGRFLRPSGDYLLPHQKRAVLQKRLAQSKELMKAAAGKEKQIRKDIERATVKLREAQRELIDGRLGAQKERDRILAGSPRALVFDMKQQGTDQAVKPLKDPQLPESVEERRLLAERQYWNTVKDLEEKFETTRERIEADIDAKKNVIDSVYEKAQSLMYLSDRETQARFNEILEEIKQVAAQVGGRNHLPVVLNRTYRGRRFYEKKGPALLEPGAVKGDGIPEDTPLAKLLALRKTLLEETRQADRRKASDPPVETEALIMVDSHLEEWFYTRNEIEEARKKYVIAPLIMWGGTDITLETLQEILIRYSVDKEASAKIVDFCRETLLHENADE